MKIAVASGKGGTGKTTIAVSFALSIEADAFLDCDVEGPNAGLFLRPEIEGRQDVFMYKPRFNKDKCRLCGLCAQACHFSAIAVSKAKLFFFDELCHGCGLCSYVCPNDAIDEERVPIGYVEKGLCGDMYFAQGRLLPGEAISPLVIRNISTPMGMKGPVVIDVPAGNACPMREAVKGSDFCLLVAEPTPFGLHDLKIAVNVMRSMEIPFAVIVNKDNKDYDGIDVFCRENNVDIVLRISFDKKLATAYAKAVPLIDVIPALKGDFKHVFNTIQLRLSHS